MNEQVPRLEGPAEGKHWYSGITRYQWLILVIASLGWVFDVFEGQIFVASMNEALPALLPAGAGKEDVPFYAGITFTAFLLGGTLGGTLFGHLSDRIGRARTMMYTILVYSLFTCLSALAQTWWHMAAFRFLVALGVGGEWAVATALVAEVFPQRARAWSLAIFHASSVAGTLLAILVGATVVANPLLGWRSGLVVGGAPALLVLWARWSLRDPQQSAKDEEGKAPTRPPAGPLRTLWQRPLLSRALIGVGLATVGLATFWGAHIYGKDVLLAAVATKTRQSLDSDTALTPAQREARMEQLGPYFKRWEMMGMLLVTVGGGVGLICFGPLSEWLGRRGAFLLFHLGALASALLLFQVVSGVAVLLVFLPVFGFLTLGMHAGYAVYFPELFPTAVRGTGAGICFNCGRLLAAPILLVNGWLQQPQWGLSHAGAATLVSLLFPLGVLLLLAAPETRGRELPA
jgi:MFS family permease